ncbi:deoxyribodipyrimidine photo-lyase [Pelodictyon luteolum]|uniref:Deoxyribodipyrimidine photo-lyase n=1 Tax=Chlorobium luteolum (strain DSM 273 / BCRC 81028 / 2530) TaxID=319225 RepID=Q3B5H5_CHLL3|nr:deoxyribodipyrimidine photo-lyase [Pelodictyon luteolum]ABB23406.1 Deoxyribodipyrimidine photo-lyase type II [Pelodictyon luteolum DSM 273]
MIDPRCISVLNSAPGISGPVIYWMSRDQRVEQNRALHYARFRAVADGAPLIVAFTLSPSFIGATFRQYDFMLRGLMEVERRLRELEIGFVLLEGDPAEAIVRFRESIGSGCVVTDYSPLRISRRWKATAAAALPVLFIEVDAHNIVPCLMASPKQEYSARTFRPKVNRLLGEFLIALPPVERVPASEPWAPTDWERVRARLPVERPAGTVRHPQPGEAAAIRHLETFIRERLAWYGERRNDPNADATSGLSPYLHFGHIWAGTVAIAVRGVMNVVNSPSPEGWEAIGVVNSTSPEGREASGVVNSTSPEGWEATGVVNSPSPEESKAAFLEELIVRRELSDNYCAYNSRYDSFDGLPIWAQDSLARHAADLREAIYTPEEFEKAVTHDPLWNAAQQELLRTGSIHGYMRMYWAKKILEWSPSPREAFETAVWLNDRYALDGRDPNGYAGVAWSIGGLHDRPWFERPVYGKIRYMNAAGCRRKFDVERYIREQKEP